MEETKLIKDGIEYTLVETPRTDFGVDYTYIAIPIEKETNEPQG